MNKRNTEKKLSTIASQNQRVALTLRTMTFVSILFICCHHYFYLFFRDGTTDVTRTWHFGVPTKWERVSYFSELGSNRCYLYFHH